MLLDFLPWVKRTAAKILKKVPTGKPLQVEGKTVIPFMRVLADYEPRPPKVELGQEDPFIIQYTGGTTGVPKGALCVHRNMLANVAQFDAWLNVEKGKETLASAFPMFHIAGLFTAIVGLCYGLTSIVIPDPRNTKHIVGEMKKYKPNWMGNVPSLYMMLLNEPEFHQLDHSHIRFCVSGAAPFPVDAIKKFENVIGKGKIIEVYGMTESCVLVTASPKEGDKKIGTVGIPLPSTRIMLVDIETGENEVPLGEEGEICSSGPQVMEGYYNKPHETANALREHHGRVWMHTGDIGVMDEQGYLRVVDRQKDMISVSGFKVFPREVEEKLYEHPAIELCAMVGLKNPDRPETEVVKLVVQKSAQYRDNLDEKVREEIIAYCKENLAAYKVPKIVEFQEIPLTAAGKVDKKALR
jgi:acyl-CoA synthetase (AMP-forming)/AMP-acid ligase II